MEIMGWKLPVEYENIVASISFFLLAVAMYYLYKDGRERNSDRSYISISVIRTVGLIAIGLIGGLIFLFKAMSILD